MPSAVLARKAIEAVGGAERFRQKSKQYAKSVRFIENNKSHLLAKYDNHWIAVYDSKLVSHGKNLKTVIRRVETRNLPVNETIVEYISSKRIHTLF